MYLEDLTQHVRRPNGRPIPGIYSVGWLDAEHDHPTGPVPEAVTDKLLNMMIDGKDIFRTSGWHACELGCDDSYKNAAGMITLKLEDRPIWFGSSELWIPGKGDIIFAAPSLIYHYITAHNYQPPQQFIDAVLAYDPKSDWDPEQELYRR